MLRTSAFWPTILIWSAAIVAARDRSWTRGEGPRYVCRPYNGAFGGLQPSVSVVNLAACDSDYWR